VLGGDHEVVARVRPAGEVQAARVGKEGPAAPGDHVLYDRADISRRDERRASSLAEMRLDRDQVALAHEVREAGGFEQHVYLVDGALAQAASRRREVYFRQHVHPLLKVDYTLGVVCCR
jgi:hypothetical protein